MRSIQFREMNADCAREIAGWRYPGEYAIYDMGGDENALAELLTGDHFIWAEGSGKAAGFAAFGNTAKVPADEPDAYLAGYIDVGLGMRPDLCGKGNGDEFFAAVMAFAQERFPQGRFRLTVARFNERAIKVYSRYGFKLWKGIKSRAGGRPFDIMILP